ncbi:MAG: hypothetical protein HOV94_30615 [Saccharothrix sp.]|nr:hypothetical protein [Saccharothrix sp.]
MRMSRFVLIPALASSLCATAVAGASASGAVTVLASAPTGGGQADRESNGPVISGNGRFVAFQSMATNLAPGGADGIFVRDLRTRRTELVSVATGGAVGNGLSWAPSISADGRYVAFQSRATNLVPGDTNGVEDVFVRDRRTGRTERVSVADDGSELTLYSQRPSISGDGRHVAFIAGSNTGQGAVLLRDRVAGRTTNVSAGYAGGGDWAETPEVSTDGRFVVFMSYSDDIVPGDVNRVSDIFVHEVATGRNTLVSVGAGGPADFHSFLPSISGNGRYVTFITQSTNLVPGHTGLVSDLFVRDTAEGRTTLVSATADGVQADEDSWDSAMDFSGRYIVYYTLATNLVPDAPGTQNVLLHDLWTGDTRLVPVGVGGARPDSWSASPSIDARGRRVAYSSGATNLVAGDVNGVEDVFVTHLDR